MLSCALTLAAINDKRLHFGVFVGYFFLIVVTMQLTNDEVDVRRRHGIRLQCMLNVDHYFSYTYHSNKSTTEFFCCCCCSFFVSFVFYLLLLLLSLLAAWHIIIDIRASNERNEEIKKTK